MKMTATLRIQSGRPTAVAVGYFDGMHRGHCAVIEEALRAKSRGFESCVFSFATESAGLPAAKQGSRLLMTPTLKSKTIAEMGADWLLLPDFSLIRGMSPEVFAIDVLYRGLNAAVVCCGYDYRFGKGASAGPLELAEMLTPFGVTVLQVGAVLDAGEPISSTRIRKALAEGNVDAAARMLGRFYAIDFPVTKGQGRGKPLGFPTANQRIPEGYAVLRHGVYATQAVVAGRTYPAVTDVGVKPTFGSDVVAAETHIEGFEGELYGRRIEIRFLAWLRPEKRFESIDALREAIAKDRLDALGIVDSMGGKIYPLQKFE
jgi:riboflavin kinase/FMN adenylyltransferase